MKKHFILYTLILVAFVSANAQKKVSILGDSYSTFKGHVQPDTNAVWYPANKNDVIKLEQTWWHQFINENGYILDTNNSFSGSTICNTGYRKEDYSDRSFITRMDKLGNPDIIFIFGSTNDSWANAPIGEYKYSDWTQEELYNFRPAMAYLLDKMKKFYPQASIYFILNSELRPEINESVYTISHRYDIPVITLFNIEKQQGHPSIAGMKSISQQIKTHLEKEDIQYKLQDIKEELKEIKELLKK